MPRDDWKRARDRDHAKKAAAEIASENISREYEWVTEDLPATSKNELKSHSVTYIAAKELIQLGLQKEIVSSFCLARTYDEQLELIDWLRTNKSNARCSTDEYNPLELLEQFRKGIHKLARRKKHKKRNH